MLRHLFLGDNSCRVRVVRHTALVGGDCCDQSPRPERMLRKVAGKSRQTLRSLVHAELNQ